MQLFPQRLITLAELVINTARTNKIRIVTAESCTGGLISGCLTEIPGASDVYDQGFVTYSNNAKMSHLNVSRRTIIDTGAVSAATALEMAEGGLHSSTADICVSVTGIAGPGGGSHEKPVGLVYIGIARKSDEKSYTSEHKFTGNRTEVRLKTVEAALHLLKKEIDEAA